MNKRLQSAAWATGMLTTLLALPSCGDGGAGGITHEYLERTVMIGAVPLVHGELTKGSWESLEAVAPLTVCAALSYGTGWNDSGPASTFMSRIEVNFGDGGGWTDLTDEMLTLFSEEGKPQKSIPPEAVSHTYATPGEFEMRARITYKDGEVVYSDAPGRLAGEVGDVVLIRVLPGAAALSLPPIQASPPTASNQCSKPAPSPLAVVTVSTGAWMRTTPCSANRSPICTGTMWCWPLALPWGSMGVTLEDATTYHPM